LRNNRLVDITSTIVNTAIVLKPRNIFIADEINSVVLCCKAEKWLYQ